MIEPQLTKFKSSRAMIGIKDLLQWEDSNLLFVLLYGACETYDFFLYYQSFQCSFSTQFCKIIRAKSKKIPNNYIKSALPDKDGMTAQTELLAVRQCHHTLAQNAR